MEIGVYHWDSPSTKTNLNLQKFMMHVVPVHSNRSMKGLHLLWTALPCLVDFRGKGNICLKVLCGCCRVVDDKLQTRNGLCQPQKSLWDPEPIYHKRHKSNVNLSSRINRREIRSSDLKLVITE